MVCRFNDIAAFVTVILTPVIVAPEASRTVPAIRPVGSCAYAAKAIIIGIAALVVDGFITHLLRSVIRSSFDRFLFSESNSPGSEVRPLQCPAPYLCAWLSIENLCPSNRRKAGEFGCY